MPFPRWSLLAAFAALALVAADLEGPALSPDGKFAARARGTEITLEDVGTGKAVASLRGHPDAVSVLEFFPDGRRLASGDESGYLLTWDVPSGKLLTRTEAGARVTAIGFEDDGEIVFVLTGSGRKRRFESATGEPDTRERDR